MQRVKQQEFSNQEFSNYKDSPLGQIIGRVLKAAQNAKKEPVNKGLSREEVKRIQSVLKVVETGLGMVHNDVLPIFDAGKGSELSFWSPSILWLLRNFPSGISLYRNVQEYCLTKEMRVFSAFQSAISEALPKLLKENKQKKLPLPFDQVVVQWIDGHKAELRKKVSEIPTTLFNTIIEAIKKNIIDHDLFRVEENEKDIIKVFNDIDTLSALLFEPLGPYESVNFCAEHQQMHSVLMELVRAFFSAPRELSELISFLNPEVIYEVSKGEHREPSALLSTILNLVSKCMPAMAHKTVKISHVPDESPSRSYVYEYVEEYKDPETGEEKKEVFTGKYDGAVYYRAGFGFSFFYLLGHILKHAPKLPENHKDSVSQLLRMAEAHYQENAGQKEIKDEIACAAFLKQFVQKRLEHIEVLYGPTVNAVPEKESVYKIGTLDYVLNLQRKIQNEETRRTVFQQLTTSKIVYAQVPLAKILKLRYYADIANAYREAGHDLSFQDFPFPPVVIGYEEGRCEIIPIHSPLFEQIDTFLEKLNFDKRVSGELHKRRDEAIRAWKAATKEDHKKWMDETMPEMEEQARELSSLMLSEKRRVIVSADIEAMEDALKTLSKEKETVQRVRAYLNGVEHNLAVFLSLPGNDFLGEDVLALKGDLDIQGEVFVKKLSDFIGRSESALHFLSREEEELKATLVEAREKAEKKLASEAAFAESMKALNLEDLERQSQEQQALLDGFGEKCLGAEKECKADQEQCGDLMKRYSIDSEELREDSAAQLEEINDQCISLIQTVNTFMGKLGLPAQTSADLLKSREMFNRGLESAKQDLKGCKEQLRMSSSAEASLNDQFKFLQLVSKHMGTALSKKVIPIKNIDGLAKSGVNKSSCTLEQLIFRLGFSQDELGKWKDYLSREKQTFTILDKKERAERFDDLNEHLKETSKILSNAIDQSSRDAESLIVLERLEDGLSGSMDELEKLFNLRELVQLKGDLKRKEEDLSRLKNEQKAVSSGLENLKECIVILKAVKEAEEAIKSFEEKNSSDSSALELYSSVDNIDAQLSGLEKCVEELSARFGNGESNAVYQVMVIKAKDVIKTMRAQFSEAVGRAFSHQDDLLRTLQREAESFSEDKVVFFLDESSYTDASALKEESAKRKTALKTLRDQVKEGACPPCYEKALSKSEGLLKEAEEKIERAVTDKHSALVQKQHVDVEDLKKRAADLGESFKGLCVRASLSTQERAISELKASCETFLGDVTQSFQNASKVNHNIDLLKDESKKIDLLWVPGDLEKEKEKIEALKQNLCRAEALVALSSRLDTYLVGRAERYGQREDERTKFVSFLQEKLRNYAADEGGKEVLLKAIKYGKKKHPGIHFTTVLNQIAVGVFDLENVDDSLDLTDLRAQEALAKVNKHSFVKHVNILYQAVKQMAEDAESLVGTDRETILNLTAALKTDLNRYVLSNPLKAESPRGEFWRFHDRFMARVHSQDDVIHRHRSIWNIIGSIALAVISLGAQLLYAKANYGRFSLCLDSVAPMAKPISRIDDTMAMPYKFVPKGG